MLEIVFLIALSSKVSAITKSKGLKPAGYILVLIVLWLVFEYLGILLGIYVLDNNLYAYLIFGIAGAAFGALLGYTIAIKAKGVDLVQKAEVVE